MLDLRREWSDRRIMGSELGNYLRDEISRRGWTQTRLASEAGLPKQTLSNVINDPANTPDLPTLVALAGALNVSLSYLLERAGYTVQRTEDPEESTRQLARQIEAFPWLQPILTWLVELDLEDRAGVIAYLESLRQQRGRGGS